MFVVCDIPNCNNCIINSDKMPECKWCAYPYELDNKLTCTGEYLFYYNVRERKHYWLGQGLENYGPPDHILRPADTYRNLYASLIVIN